VPKVNELLTQFPVLINRYIGYETFSLWQTSKILF
jgi:hypothetical protein